MKFKEKIQEFKELSLEGLRAKEQELSEEFFWLGIKHRSGQIANHASIGTIKKDLARVKTFLREKEQESTIVKEDKND